MWWAWSYARRPNVRGTRTRLESTARLSAGRGCADAEPDVHPEPGRAPRDRRAECGEPKNGDAAREREPHPQRRRHGARPRLRPGPGPLSIRTTGRATRASFDLRGHRDPE